MLNLWESYRIVLQWQHWLFQVLVKINSKCFWIGQKKIMKLICSDLVAYWETIWATRSWKMISPQEELKPGTTPLTKQMLNALTNCRTTYIQHRWQGILSQQQKNRFLIQLQKHIPFKLLTKCTYSYNDQSLTIIDKTSTDLKLS